MQLPNNKEVFLLVSQWLLVMMIIKFLARKQVLQVVTGHEQSWLHISTLFLHLLANLGYKPRP